MVEKLTREIDASDTVGRPRAQASLDRDGGDRACVKVEIDR